VTACKITIPETYGAIDADSTAVVKVNGHEVDVTAATVAAVHDNVTVVRSATNDVTVTVATGTPEVEVDFKLKYPKVFIIGEGPNFPMRSVWHGDSRRERQQRTESCRPAPTPQRITPYSPTFANGLSSRSSTFWEHPWECGRGIS